MENHDQAGLDWGTSPRYLDYMLAAALAINAIGWAWILLG
jgi:hypothetical protein